MTLPDHLLNDLPDPESARQFIAKLSESHPSHSRKLLKQTPILSDVLTLAAYSPLLSTTLLQNPDYIWWLNRRRNDKGLRGKDELLESLARFSLTNSTLDNQVMFARFRRRELLRIYLADIRRQLTIAEITEELSNLADAILEFALRIARQETENRFGAPQETDEKGRERHSKFCVVTLGKLGSRELNYSSDIDLLFLYSAEGTTTGTGSRGTITNREYFVKLAELIAKLIGQQTGEGATYRVDLRLRPHGKVGPLAMSLADTERYYKTEAADWERQVLIRSRAGAGDAELFSQFFKQVEPTVFSASQSVASALRSVRRSKQKIDIEHGNQNGFNVKLGKGGIREIEFIAQALQLAYGGRDRWLRAGHTLISLSRLADRTLIEDAELPQLYGAYEFLRRLEHILQMENGLQTHLVPNDPARRTLVARRMRCTDTDELDRSIEKNTAIVSSIFRRIFSDENIESAEYVENVLDADPGSADLPQPFEQSRANIFPDAPPKNAVKIVERFAEMANAHSIAVDMSREDLPDYRTILSEAVARARDLGSKLAMLRTNWHEHLINIAALDSQRLIEIKEAKHRQTLLAEASIEVALDIAREESGSGNNVDSNKFGLAVLGLGKLGGAGIDYESDLDLVLVYDDAGEASMGITAQEYFSRAAETFVGALSNYTREGNLYRVDLRLRPHGKNGPNVISRSAFAEYMRTTAAIWELLAFVKLRAIGSGAFALGVEREISRIVHERGTAIPATELAAETRRVRALLEKEKGPKRANEVNIKHGPGGMLDIYFAIRFLQLRDNLPDEVDNRSSNRILERLHAGGSLSTENFQALHDGYQFLSSLDHAMRLIIGRSHTVPHSAHPHFASILEWLGTSSNIFLGDLTLHRIAIREAFDSVTKT